MTQSPTGIPLIARAASRGEATAILADEGRFSYDELLRLSAGAANVLLDGAADLKGERVAFMVPPSMGYVLAMWGCWRAGGCCVPLCISHPAPELAHVIDDSGASILIASDEHAEVLKPLAQERGLRFVRAASLWQDTPGQLPEVEAQRNALLVYTSGTTGKPKGALTNHAIMAAQLDSVTRAWEWSAQDHILNVLPWHHVHGILNVLSAALYTGATCEIMPRFDAEALWGRIADSRELTLFMAVPTIYARLTKAWEQADTTRQAQMTQGCERLRLMVCGSAALPVPTLERWREISGHTLLERYGMTEIGMGLGNPLHGERMPGHVGTPFPGVQVRLVDEGFEQVPDGSPGQILIKGPNVFKGYWRRADATADAFTKDGWFKTGDTAVREQGGVFRILGRNSVDILKTGGFKVSALEIEAALREHPAIAELAVVGVPDEEWGQRVAAAVILREGHALELDALRRWGKERLAPYKVPTLLKAVQALPCNALGKVVKPRVLELFE